jgi:hypothetical protein
MKFDENAGGLIILKKKNLLKKLRAITGSTNRTLQIVYLFFVVLINKISLSY